MLMRLFPSWPGSLIDVPDDDERKSDCRWAVDVIAYGFLLGKIIELLMTFLVVLYQSRPRWSWTDGVVVGDGYSSA